jgi:hypothetical protein
MCVGSCAYFPEAREPGYLILLTDAMVMFWHTVYGVFL